MDRGWALSTLKVQVAALSVYLDSTIAGEPLVIRFLGAISGDRTPALRVCPKWDLSLVLQEEVKPPFKPLSETSIELLTLKMVFLIVVTTSRGVSELQALSIRPTFHQTFEDTVVRRVDPAFLPKVVSTFHFSQDIVLSTFVPHPANEKERSFHYLDVKRCLLAYMVATSAFSKSEAIFVLLFRTKQGLTSFKVNDSKME